LLWVASHAEGLGEIVDAIGIILEGFQFKQILQDLWDYATGAIGATTAPELDAAAQHFADAVAVAGVAKIIELMGEFSREGKGEGKSGKAEGQAEPQSGEPTPPAERPAEQPGPEPAPGEREPAAGPKVVDEAASADGERTLEILEDGECDVCASPCKDIREKYSAELTNNPDLAAELDKAAEITDVKAQEAKYKEIEQKLANAQAAPAPGLETPSPGASPESEASKGTPESSRATKEPYRGASGEIIDPTTVDVYRGGSSFELKPGEIRVGKDGLVRPTHGPSLDTDPSFGAVASRGANKVKSIPDELQIIQRGGRATHFEVVPKEPMTPERFQELLRQIVVGE
jgi:hypothetical protein